LPILVAFVLWGPGILSAIRSVPHMISFFVSSALLSGCVLSLYTYITTCIGLAIRRHLRERQGEQ